MSHRASVRPDGRRNGGREGEGRVHHSTRVVCGHLSQRWGAETKVRDSLYHGIPGKCPLMGKCPYTCTYMGIGLSIALKAERGIPDWLWGAVAQWSEHLQLKQEALGSIPSGCPGFFIFQQAYTNVNGMKDLWCSSTVRLLSTQI